MIKINEEKQKTITFVHGGLINYENGENMRKYIQKEQAELINNININKDDNFLDLFVKKCSAITTIKEDEDEDEEFAGNNFDIQAKSILWNRHIEKYSKKHCNKYRNYEPNTTFVVGHCQTTTTKMGNPRKDCHDTNKYGKLNCIYPTCFHENSQQPAAIMTDVALSSAFEKDKISPLREIYRTINSTLLSREKDIFEILLIKIENNDFKFFSVRKEPLSGIIETPLLNPALNPESFNKTTGGFPKIIKSTKKTNIGVTNKNKKKHRSVSKSKTVRYHRKRQHRNKSKKKHNKTN
jgi:hypothetical protein